VLIKKPIDIPSSEITDKSVYLNRRKFMLGAAVAGTAVAAGKVLGSMYEPAEVAAAPSLAFNKSSFSTTEKANSLKDITNYNNFYEFGTDKGDPARESGKFRPRPWAVAVEGHIKQPKMYDLDSILKNRTLEERIYRLRCVEGWSMVIPWVGFPLGDFIRELEPASKAKYVAFTTVFSPDQMPGQRRGVLDWPYVEGLRMDEALHPLTILAVGLYGEVLPNQNGAPLRLVVPWKYGFKSIKSIVKIRFVENEPETTWNKMQPREYGFYSNVNPRVDHPRWSQATERRIGEFRRRDTLLFNGYADQVAGLYAGMDLRKHY